MPRCSCFALILAACASTTDAFTQGGPTFLSMSAQHRNSASSLHLNRRQAIATVPGFAGALVLPSVAEEAMQWPAALTPDSVLSVGDALKLPAIGFGM